MKRFLILSLLSIAACGEDPNSLTGHGKAITEPAGSVAAAALQCTDAPQGRSYTLFDGSKLEANRVNEGAAVNRARTKPYSVLAGEYQRVLGAVPSSLAKAGGSFDDPPARWYAEPAYGGVSIHAVFDLSFEACTTFARDNPAMASAPTSDSAAEQCRSLMRKAWNRTASPTEIDACVDLATKKLSSESDSRKQWSYVCSSILSSSLFLTY